MKKYLFLLLLAFAGLSASARTNVYDLRSFYVGEMPVYLATPDKAQAVFGRPLQREGYLNLRGGYAVNPYIGMAYPWYPWGGVSFAWSPYMSRPEYLGTMVLIYHKFVLYFDQDHERGEAYVSNVNIYTPDVPLYYGNTKIRVGDRFESLATVFPGEYRKALKKSGKDVFFVHLKVDAGRGMFRQRGKITLIIKDMRIDAVQMVLK